MGLCGVVGFTCKSWRPDSDRIRAAAATLFHRGPDQQGVLQSGLCSLGATRLKIIDLSSGDQPIVSDDGAVAIVFYGVLYNPPTPLRELGSMRHQFHVC